MVAPIFKHNIYAGVYDDLGPLDTPINFFETDPALISKYQLMKLSDVYESLLTAGDCLFIPAYYWFQSSTEPVVENIAQGSPESLFLTFEFEASSEMVDHLIRAIDEGILDNEII
mmetsp:Transcript_981/g.1762  ORF Transcript_981/g.1762 Transcript_981/m.1762 type:complete len:115 (+) Transcript_981:942-1286(+)